jgi:cell division protein FtsN
MSDEGFHEIQLNGKQLVFLFMAATVVSVVIFLCGVMVGRGVRDRTVSAAAPEASASTAPTDTASTQGDASVRTLPEPAPASGASQAQPVPQSAPQQPAATTATQSDTPPTPPQEDDAYYDDLVKGRKDALTAPKGRTAPATKPSPPAATAARNAPSASPPLPPAPAVTEHTSMSGGYAVQLAAVRERGEADAIAQRLVAKGYQAYVLVPQPGKPPVYRVQVGRFKSRGDADRVAARLRKNEQFKPWVTR